MIYNNVTKTKPCVIHCPGNFNHFHWKKIKIPNKNYETDPNISVITWNTGKYHRGLGLLEKSLGNYPIINCAEKFNGIWANDWKISLLATQELETPYIIGSDSSDVIFLESPTEVLNRFLKMECLMLFNAEKVFFPGENKHFQDSIAQNKPYKYLNSGVWIAKTEFLKEIIEIYLKCLADYPVCQFTGSDQLIWHKVFKMAYPKIMLDYNCEIFQVIANLDPGEINALDLL